MFPCTLCSCCSRSRSRAATPAPPLTNDPVNLFYTDLFLVLSRSVDLHYRISSTFPIHPWEVNMCTFYTKVANMARGLLDGFDTQMVACFKSFLAFIVRVMDFKCRHLCLFVRLSTHTVFRQFNWKDDSFILGVIRWQFEDLCWVSARNVVRKVAFLSEKAARFLPSIWNAGISWMCIWRWIPSAKWRTF